MDPRLESMGKPLYELGGIQWQATKTISGMTEMFRDPDYFQIIRNELLPYLETFAHIHIWHAGCSTGEEAYSMAILLNQAGLMRKTTLFATDIYQHRLVQGKMGRYAANKYERFVQNFQESGIDGNLDKYLKRQANYLQIRDELRSSVNFFQHDLIHGGSLNSFSCIFCRNVLFYYPPKVKETILKNLLYSLAPNGFLVLGKVEDLRFSPFKDQVKVLHKGYSIYQKMTF